MKPAPFSYRVARSHADVVQGLGEGTRILAGGQSLVPMLNLRLAPADGLIDITRLPDLRAVVETPTSIRYGALTTHAAFEDGLVPDESNGLVRHVAGTIAYRAVRTRGTIGGSLALADPAADWVTVAVALEATIHIAGGSGHRAVPAEAFVVGSYSVALEDGEFIEAVEMPRRAPTETWGHQKVVVKTGEYAKSMAIALCDRSRRSARIVLGAADGAPLVLRNTAAAVVAGAAEADLAAVAQAEISGAERDFSAAKLIMHTTAVTRAIKGATAS